MKKTFRNIVATFLCVSAMVCCNSVQADNVTPAKARQVGAYFLASQVGSKSITAENLKLVYELPNLQKNIPALYCFNTADDNGFVVVAGDDCLSPIVAYSTDGHFDPNNVPEGLMWFLNEQAQLVSYAQNNELATTKDVAHAWNELINEELPYFGTSTKAITILMKSKWNQSPIYNVMCPIDGTGNRSVTGCVATAMAQIIYYWRYPWVGKGQNSYSCSGIGTVSADFSQAFYNYNAMLDSLTYLSPQESIDAVALLNFHCGVSVDMGYSSNTSGAQSTKVPKALRQNFKYVKDSMAAYDRTSIDYFNPNYATNPNDKDTAWVELIKKEIAKKRPVYYSGHDLTSTGEHAGHAFVCDGYNSVNKMLHFNWGWGGAGDCFCNVYKAQLKPTGQGYNFSSTHYIIAGIQPPKDSLMVGIQEVQSNPFTAAIYPNPASSEVNVAYSLQDGQPADMQIFDVAGRLVETVHLNAVSTRVRISVSDYRPGIYVCRLNGYSAKFVVQ